MMEDWQKEIIEGLMKGDTFQVEQDSRIYSSSQTYGPSRYHMLDKLSAGGVTITQTNIEDKWGAKIKIEDDQLPVIIKALLVWHMEEIRKQQEAQNNPFGSDELDDHPF